MEPRISIITLGVNDFVRSLRFYRDGLGWPTRATDTSDIAFFNTTGTHFAIYPLHKLAEDISSALPPARSGFSGITLAHNVRTREEVAGVLAHAEAAGAAIVKPAQDALGRTQRLFHRPRRLLLGGCLCARIPVCSRRFSHPRRMTPTPATANDPKLT